MKRSSNRLFWLLTLLATPSLLWSLALCLAGTAMLIVTVFGGSSFMVLGSQSTSDTIASFVEMAGVLFLAPIGLFALVQLAIVLASRARNGRPGLQRKRGAVVRGLATGFVPLASILIRFTLPLPDPLGPDLVGDDGLEILRWAIMSGWPLVPLIVLLIVETWSGPRPGEADADKRLERGPA